MKLVIIVLSLVIVVLWVAFDQRGIECQRLQEQLQTSEKRVQQQQDSLIKLQGRLAMMTEQQQQLISSAKVIEHNEYLNSTSTSRASSPPSKILVFFHRLVQKLD